MNVTDGGTAGWFGPWNFATSEATAGYFTASGLVRGSASRFAVCITVFGSWLLCRQSTDRITVNRARKIQRFLSQPFFVGEVFTGLPGIFVPIQETVESFEALVNGELDDVPEQAFFNVGGVESVLAKAKSLQES